LRLVTSWIALLQRCNLLQKSDVTDRRWRRTSIAAAADGTSQLLRWLRCLRWPTR